LGVPYNMDGSSGDAVVRMNGMMEFLSASLNIPLSGVDERLSTIEALERWRELTPRKRKKYRTVDSLAAAFILERYLREG
jgi:putative transcription antitermination factor YqgF